MPLLRAQHTTNPRPLGTTQKQALGSTRDRHLGGNTLSTFLSGLTLCWKEGPPGPKTRCFPLFFLLTIGHQERLDRVCLFRSEAVGWELKSSPSPTCPVVVLQGPPRTEGHLPVCSRHHLGWQGRSCQHHIGLEPNIWLRLATFPNEESWARMWE